MKAVGELNVTLGVRALWSSTILTHYMTPLENLLRLYRYNKTQPLKLTWEVVPLRLGTPRHQPSLILLTGSFYLQGYYRVGKFN